MNPKTAWFSSEVLEQEVLEQEQPVFAWLKKKAGELGELDVCNEVERKGLGKGKNKVKMDGGIAIGPIFLLEIILSVTESERVLDILIALLKLSLKLCTIIESFSSSGKFRVRVE